MNRNDSNDVARSARNFRRDITNEDARVAAVVAAWEDGNEDAFDAPAPRVIMQTFEES